MTTPPPAAAPRHRARLPVLLYAQPFEVAFGLILLLSSLRALGVAGPSSVAELGDGLRYAYAAACAVAGALLLVGLAGRAHAFYRALEKAGLFLAVGVFSSFGAAILLEPDGQLSGVIQLLVAGACLCRALAIREAERIVLDELRTANLDGSKADAVRALLERRRPS